MSSNIFASMSAGIKPKSIEEEIRTSYLTYSMSVIVSRALPDARDGLKPVQRRILYSMNDLNLTASAKYRKCAKVVGDCMGNYHPHGDASIYDALVRMAQEFSVRYPLIDPQGNFGSIDGYPAAAQRYTECRMAKITAEMLTDLDKETVDFTPNYDETSPEPVVLPAKAPMLLLNGASGIAVGMATSIPPHNLREVGKGIIALLDDPDITVKDLCRYVQGPDFPTGGLICGREGINKAYHDGRGQVVMRARCHVETKAKSEKQSIVVTEIPYQVGLNALVTKVADVVKDGRIDGIANIHDFSNKDGIRVVIELKSGENPDVILNQLYKLTPLQSTFSINNIALIKGRPETLNIKQMMECYRDHRIEVIRRRTAFLLNRAEARAHILDGLLIALANIERVIAIIRASQDAPAAKVTLSGEFKLSDLQAQAILDMRLARLTNLQRLELEREHSELMGKIAQYKDILADRKLVMAIIREDLLELIDKHGDARRTEIVAAAEDISLEDMIAEEEMAVVVSHDGYIKRMALDVYHKQGRGGRGITGSGLKDGDFIEHLFVGITHDYILFFTTKGQVHWLKVYDVPEMGRASKGRSISNLLSLDPGERVSALIPVREFDQERFLVMATREGVIKKTPLAAFQRPKKGGIRALNISDGDELIGVVMTTGKDELMLASREGIACRFKETDVRSMGRNATGVSGMKLGEGDFCIGLLVMQPNSTVLTISELGMGKRSDFTDYRLTHRGAKGVINMSVTDRTGVVVSCMSVQEEDEVMIITSKGMVVRTPVNGIRVIGRATQGVKCIRLKEDDSVVAVARLVGSDKDVPGSEADGETPILPDSGEEQDLVPDSGDNGSE
ncbi:MAG: DNA gyrase subunit A [Planctomycetota bacterium]|jgi:DNA gyrase subunit A|nr:DNA gyrase subunit A [Planctomycetota bacterium]